jgi:hypothetical protein
VRASSQTLGFILKPAGAVLAIIAIAGAMVASIYYPFPNGKAMTVSDFIQLWFLEIIIIGFVAVVFLIAGVHWLWRRLQPPQKSDHDAP